MTDSETTLEMTERHVRESEARVARQEALLAELQRDGHTGHVLELGAALLDTLRATLELAREDLLRERANASRDS